MDNFVASSVLMPSTDGDYSKEVQANAALLQQLEEQQQEQYAKSTTAGGTNNLGSSISRKQAEVVGIEIAAPHIYRARAEDLQEAGIIKPLAERLKENREIAEKSFEEQHKFKGPKALDRDDVTFLMRVEEQERKKDRERRQREQDEVAEYKAALSERQHKAKPVVAAPIIEKVHFHVDPAAAAGEKKSTPKKNKKNKKRRKVDGSSSKKQNQSDTEESDAETEQQLQQQNKHKKTPKKDDDTSKKEKEKEKNDEKSKKKKRTLGALGLLSSY